MDDRDDRAFVDMIPFQQQVRGVFRTPIPVTSSYNREHRQMSHAEICGWFEFCGAGANYGYVWPN